MLAFEKVLGHIAEKLEWERTAEVMSSQPPTQGRKSPPFLTVIQLLLAPDATNTFICVLINSLMKANIFVTHEEKGSGEDG